MTNNYTKINEITFVLSIILILISILILTNNKLNLGIEFTGGIEIEIESSNLINIDEIKKNIDDIKNSKIKYSGSKKNIQIKIKISKKEDIIEKIKKKIEITNEKNYTKIIKIEYIGAEINKETIKNSINAIILSLVVMTIYLIIRFEYKTSISTVLALIHDIVLILGILSLFKIEFNLSTLAAILAVIGYSVNNSVIIFDRIRENINTNNNKKIIDIINNSINETISRTMLTSSSTLLVTLTLMIVSKETLFIFGLILTLGIIIGTYSSIYISTMLYYILNKKIK